jgi:hypothetical protein
MPLLSEFHGIPDQVQDHLTNPPGITDCH